MWSLLSSFSRYQNIYSISDSYFKSLASGYLGKCRTTLNTICLVVCEDIIVRTPSLCTWLCYNVICMGWHWLYNSKGRGKWGYGPLRCCKRPLLNRYCCSWIIDICRTSEKRDHGRPYSTHRHILSVSWRTSERYCARSLSLLAYSRLFLITPKAAYKSMHGHGHAHLFTSRRLF